MSESTWHTATLIEVARLRRGFDLPEPMRVPGPYPVLGSSGISGWHNEGPVPGPGVTIGRSGASIGVATYYEGAYWPLNTTLYVEDFHGNDPSYVYRLLKTIDFAAYNSGSAQPSLNRNFLSHIRVPLPGLETQRGVSRVLGALDDKIAVNERIATTVKQLLDAHFADLANSAHHVAQLHTLIDLHYGKALKGENRTAGDVPVFGGNGISGWHDTPLTTGPGVIVGRKGANAGSVSWSQGDFWPIDTSFFVETRADLRMEFVYFLLESANLRRLVGDSAIPGLSRDVALHCEVAVPRPEAIQSFSAMARPMLQLIDQTSGENRTLAELRDTLLPKLISGELRIQDAEQQVTEAV